jgi:hypothetical protein
MAHLQKAQLLTLLLIIASFAVVLKASTQAVDTSPDDGYISEGRYVNKFFDFTYKLPQGLIPNSTTFKKHPNTSSGHFAETFILLLAATPVKPYKNVAISVQSASDVKDGAAYLHKVAAAAMRNGLSVLGGPTEHTLAGKPFYRQDFYSSQGAFIQTQVCTVYKDYALDFVFSAKERADVEGLFNSLRTLRFGTTDKSVQ